MTQHEPAPDGSDPHPRIESVSAVTLAVHQIERAVRFYEALGFQLEHSRPRPDFVTLTAGCACLNLILQPPEKHWKWWGRVIFHVADVDALHRLALAAGLTPDASPRDAPWGERFFHITDPDGHELSFAQKI